MALGPLTALNGFYPGGYALADFAAATPERPGGRIGVYVLLAAAVVLRRSSGSALRPAGAHRGSGRAGVAAAGKPRACGPAPILSGWLLFQGALAVCRTSASGIPIFLRMTILEASSDGGRRIEPARPLHIWRL
jgi:hypothetical protein